MFTLKIRLYSQHNWRNYVSCIKENKTYEY